MGDELNELAEAFAGRYEVEREVGRGGMATVYRARDVKHDRPVALKVLHPELASAVGAQRFLREIRIAAGLQHPFILPLYDSGQAGDRLYYAMPYVEGQSLRDRLDQEVQLSVEEALRITREVAQALAYAHAEGVVHRDIKPENILLHAGCAVLADFGVARALSEAGGGELTQSGLALGTPAYMSPEQFTGDGTIDGRSDIYSLGCVLYEMLTGSPPFTGRTAQVVMARHAVDPVPPIRTARATVPEAVEHVVMRSLAKVPADRFATADRLLEALPAGPAVSGSFATSAPADRAADPAPQKRSFFAELKRRKVYQAGVIYIGIGFGVLEGAQAVLPSFESIPPWAYDFLVLGVLMGLPLVVVLAWAYDITSRGLVRSTTTGQDRYPPVAPAGAALRRRLLGGALGVIGLAAFVLLYPQAFLRDRPRIDVSRADARARAEAFLAERGAVGAFERVMVLHRDTLALLFLQHELGYADARAWLDRLPVWHWHVRWFRPGQRQDWSAGIGAAGSVVEFTRTLEESAPGAHLEQEAAQTAVEEFLRGMGWDPARLEPVEASGTRRAARSDHRFAWHRPLPGAAGSADAAETGAYRIGAELHGDAVGGYQVRFRVPERFRQQIRPVGIVRDGLLAALLFFFAVAMVIVLVRRQRAGDIRWRPALVLAGLVAALLVAEQITSWPEVRYGYSGEIGYGLFLAGKVVETGFLGLLAGSLTLLIAAAGESIARGVYPRLLGGYHELMRGRLAHALDGAVLGAGYALALLSLGYGAAAAAALRWIPGAWGGPTGAEYSSMHAYSPAADVILEALATASVTGLALLLAIAALRRFTRSTAIAVVLPAILLGVLIPAGNPIYVGAPLSAAGSLILLVGCVRLGALPLMVAVYVTEVVTSGAFLLTAGTPDLRLDGILVLAAALLPVLPAVLARYRQRPEPAGEPAAEAVRAPTSAAVQPQPQP